MAFSNRFGSLMRQTISQNSISNGQVSMASMLNAIHCLAFGTDIQSLNEAFSGFCDPLNGRNIRVSYANDRPSAPRSNYGGGGGYGGSGGYGSRGGYGDARENDVF
ncbi:hypothetical protein CsSME_00020303 [Camellia sinensis var. sinensis]